MIRKVIDTEVFEKIFVDDALVVFRYYITQNGKKFDFNEKRRFPIAVFDGKENYDFDTIIDLSSWFVKNLYHYRSAPFESLLDKFVVRKIRRFNKDIAFFISDHAVPSEGIVGTFNKVRTKVVAKKFFCLTKNIFEFKKGQLFVPDYYIVFKNTKPEESSLNIEVSSMLGKLYFYRTNEVF